MAIPSIKRTWALHGIRAKGGATAEDMFKGICSIGLYYKPVHDYRAFKYTVVQVGIVGCCPRLLPRILISQIQRLPGGGRFISYFDRNPQLHSVYGKAWVSPIKFKESIIQMTKEVALLSDHLFFVEIAHPCHFLIENCGDFSKQVDKNNAIHHEIDPFSVITPFSDSKSPEDLLLPDGHHLTLKGHRAVAESLKQHISSINNSK